MSTRPPPAQTPRQSPPPGSGPLAGRLHRLLGGSHPAWGPFLERHCLLDAARAALAAVERDLRRHNADTSALAPREDLIFESLRYFGPSGALVVIVGQDPYPRGAQGLCFSVAPSPHRAIAPSLRAILQNLARQGHLCAGAGAPATAVRGDLSSWAAQGVLLLNAALTTRRGTRGAHRKCWRPFTQGLMDALATRAAARGRPLVFMLWGSDAKSMAPAACADAAAPSVAALVWSHPSPCADNNLPPARRFANAPHFRAANRALRLGGFRPVVWDPLGVSVVFTDGACARNGRPEAAASFAATFVSGPLRRVELAGRVAPREYVWADKGCPVRGFAPRLDADAPRVAPTNNRGEYLAWCWALLLLLRGGVRGRVEIVSDCKLFIRTMEEWLPARRAQGTAEALSNYDLVEIAETLLAALRAQCVGVALTHTNSHRPRPPAAAGPRAQALWYGNFRADQIAAAALRDAAAPRGDASLRDAPPSLSIMAQCPALEWRLLGRFAASASHST